MGADPMEGDQSLRGTRPGSGWAEAAFGEAEGDEDPDGHDPDSPPETDG